MASYLLALFIFIVVSIITTFVILLFVNSLITRVENNAIAGLETVAEQLAPKFDASNPTVASNLTALSICLGIKIL